MKRAFSFGKKNKKSGKENPVVRRLSKSKINALNFLGRSFRKKGEKSGPLKTPDNAPNKTPVETPVKKGNAPPMIDIYAGSDVDQQSQAHSQLSEKAKTTLVSPKATNQGKEDWKLLYELACQFDKFKLQEAEEMKKQKPKEAPQKKHAPGDAKGTKKSLEAIFGGVNFRADGSFLDKKFIDQYLVEEPKFSSVTFDFSGQGKLYKRFNRKNDEQKTICKKFAAALLQHPKSSKITQLNLSNALLPDAFLEALSDQCIASGGKGLPMLQALNLESNVLGKPGIDALCRCIADAKVWPRLQVLKLENQQKTLTTNAEETLGEVVVENTSLVVVGYRVRSGIPKQQIDNTVRCNLDKLRQARRMHASKAGTLKARKRNEMELYFDKIASNADRSVVNVDLTGNLKFLGLNATERTKTGAAFATNKTVKTVKMVKLKLDDAFAEAFGSALATNTTLETVILDSNAFSGTGMMALLSGLGKNTTISNFQVRHQSKTMSSSDEEKLPDLLKDNTTVLKLGIDARNPLIKRQLERKANDNSELQRKLRAAAKKNKKK
mmetsp:Transcript_30637/g.72274  ORF Transcript_30637/g.72274 Transcript_30637/m.72274 type:complete len:551 (-) Transcript_30637:662-2314(-)